MRLPARVGWPEGEGAMKGRTRFNQYTVTPEQQAWNDEARRTMERIAAKWQGKNTMNKSRTV